MSDLTPYLCVADSRAAIDWYGEVLQATVKGKPYVMADGRIGHVELIIGDALLMMADPFPEVDVEPPDTSKGSAVSLHLEVPDCDAVAEAAVRNGVQLDRGPESTSHGRSATFRDPFGHRWIVSS
ncbi:MAG TPA: VOC family protein [Propionibacteriaceae bacterium]